MVTFKLTYLYINKPPHRFSERCGGARARSKGAGSRPSSLGKRPAGVGLRGFKSHPPHHKY